MKINFKNLLRKFLLYILIFSMIYQSGSVLAALQLSTPIVQISRILILVIPFFFISNIKDLKNSFYILIFMLLGSFISFQLYNSSIIRLLYKIITLLLFFYVCSYTYRKNLNLNKIVYNVIYIISIITLIFYITTRIFHIEIPFNYAQSGDSYYYKNCFDIYFYCESDQLLPRLNGLFWEPGVYSIFLNLELFLYFFSEDISKKKQQLFIILVSLILTQSAAGYCVMALIIYTYLSSTKYFTKKSRTLIAIYLALILVIMIGFILITKRNTDTVDLANYSYGLRVSDLLNGLQLFIAHPIFGLGYGNNHLFIANDIFGRGSSNGLVSWMYMTGLYGTTFALYPFIANIKANKSARGIQLLWFLMVIIFNTCEPLYSLPIMQFLLAREYHQMFTHRKIINKNQ